MWSCATLTRKESFAKWASESLQWRTNPITSGIGYGQYGSLRGVAYLDRGSINRIVNDYQRGRAWSEITTSNGSGVNEFMVWLGEFMRTVNNLERQLKSQQPRPGTRLRP
jgi:hypothetical protein